jgi:hypothetical protein
MDDVSAAHALTLYKNSKARFAPSSRAAEACTLPFRPAEAVPYLSRKYGQQQKRVARQNGREPF